jgi:hypothetical protein
MIKPMWLDMKDAPTDGRTVWLLNDEGYATTGSYMNELDGGYEDGMERPCWAARDDYGSPDSRYKINAVAWWPLPELPKEIK